MKKILLDTTYLLPAVGLSVENIPDDLLLTLTRSSEYEVYINTISLFEIMAKTSKYVVRNLLKPIRVIRGLKAILYSDDIVKVDYVSDTDLVTLSFQIRTYLNDYIDSLILASAIKYADILLTEDFDLLNTSRKEWFKELALKYNPSLLIINYKRYRGIGKT